MDYLTGEEPDVLRMIKFMRYVIVDIGLGTVQRRDCFTMDNLSSQHNLQMATIILNAGHRIVFRVTYYPVDSPIAYVFNIIQGTLQISTRLIEHDPTLVEELSNVVTVIPNVHNYPRSAASTLQSSLPFFLPFSPVRSVRICRHPSTLIVQYSSASASSTDSFNL